MKGNNVRARTPIELMNRNCGGSVYGELRASSMRFRVPLRSPSKDCRDSTKFTVQAGRSVNATSGVGREIAVTYRYVRYA